MVEYRYLGSSGFKVSEVTLGNWVTHGSQVGSEVAIATVHKALDLGITSFDTADAYANRAAEQILGEALRGQRRQSLEIFTKVYWPTGPGGANDCGLSRKHIMDSAHNSLRNLGTDYIDLYQAHRYDYETPLEETMVAFADLVRQGKVLYIGVSEWTAEQIREAAQLARELRIQLVTNQPQYSLLHRVIEAKVIPTCEELGMTQIVWSPMAQGVLTGKYLPGQPAPEGTRATAQVAESKFIQKFMDDQTLTAVQQLRPIADSLGLTLAQLAIAWVLQNPNVSAALVGASRPEQLEDTVRASGVSIPVEVMEQIASITEPVANLDPQDTYTVSPASRPC